MSPMNISRVAIDITFGRLGMDHTPYERELNQEIDSLEVSRDTPRVNISSRDVAVEIDMYPMLADLGKLNYRDRRAQMAQEGMEAGREAIAYYAELGDRMADFQNNSIGSIAAEDNAPEMQQVEIDYISPPEFAVQPGELSVELDSADFAAQTTRRAAINRPDYHFQPGQIERYLMVEPDITLSLRGRNLDVQA